MQPLEVGEPTVIGPYRLLGRLGSGGMGRVYLGRSGGGRTVAVKVVHPHFALDEEFRERFRREVAAARQVGGAWTAPVLDADPEASVPWVATGYVAGPSLSAAVGPRGTLDALPEHAVRVLGAGLGESLAAVHALGLVHRDVKPSNVLLSLDGPRLIDFGIARATDGTASLTSTGVSIGSPGYMAPEQILGKGVTGASDMFSLGAVLAFAATGGAPFAGDSSAALLYKVVHEEPELSLIEGDLHEMIAACLAKTAADRPTPQELARRLAPEGAAGLAAAGWLPKPLVEQVSRSAVSLLDLETAEAPSGPVPFARPSVPGEGPAPTEGGGPAQTAGGPAPSGQFAAAAGGFGPPDPSFAEGLSAAQGAGVHPPTEVPGQRQQGDHSAQLTQTAGGPGRVAVSVAADTGAGPGGKGRRVSCTVALAVAGALAAVTVGSAFLFDLMPGGGGGSEQPPSAGQSGDASASSSPSAEPGSGAIPEFFLGTWRGKTKASILGGRHPAGTVKIVVRQGGKGETVGTAATTDELGTSTCVDRLVLKSASAQRLVATGKPQNGDDGRCSSNTSTFVLVRDGKALKYSLDDPGAGDPSGRLSKLY